MDNEIDGKTTASILRECAAKFDPDSHESIIKWLEDKADCYEPPDPEMPNGHVWYQGKNFSGNEWFAGVKFDKSLIRRNGVVENCEDCTIRPARALAPNEIAIQIPHTDVWPRTIDGKCATRADLVWTFIDPHGWCFNSQIAKHGSITRAEAERMEARS